jgi:hypothetical protein
MHCCGEGLNRSCRPRLCGIRSLLAPVTCVDRRLVVIGNDDHPSLPPALRDPHPALRPASPARPVNDLQGHRTARSAPRDRRTAPCQSPAPAGLGRPRGPRRADPPPAAAHGADWRERAARAGVRSACSTGRLGMPRPASPTEPPALSSATATSGSWPSRATTPDTASRRHDRRRAQAQATQAARHDHGQRK